MTIADINKIIWSIDEEEGILDYKLANGMSCWLVIRYEIFKWLLEGEKLPAEKNNQPVIASLKRKIENRILAWRNIRESYRRDPLEIKTNYNCINVCTSIATVPGENGYRSRVSGFLDNIPGLKPLHAISIVDGAFHKKYEGAYCFIDAILHRAFKNNARYVKKTTTAVKENVDAFIRILEKYIGRDISQPVVSQLLAINAAAPRIEKLVEFFFKQVNPSLVIIEDGNYGGILAVSMISVAKKMKIPTAEIQHGVFDLAFKYADKIIKQPHFSRHKTDYVLTYGDFFTQYIHSSSINISIGNSYLETRNKVLSGVVVKEPLRVILLIAQMNYTNDIIAMLDEALGKLPGSFKLIIRLHPLDKTSINKYECFMRFPGTVFSTKEDLYSQMITADHIVGSYSTVLFDAVFFYKIPFIHKNDLSDYFVPPALGPRFSNADELLELMEKPQVWQEVKEMSEYIWMHNCLANFENFWETYILNKSN